MRKAPKGLYAFKVVYSDNTAVKALTLGKGALLVTGPRKYKSVATLVSRKPWA